MINLKDGNHLKYKIYGFIFIIDLVTVNTFSTRQSNELIIGVHKLSNWPIDSYRFNLDFDVSHDYIIEGNFLLILCRYISELIQENEKPQNIDEYISTIILTTSSFSILESNNLELSAKVNGGKNFTLCLLRKD